MFPFCLYYAIFSLYSCDHMQGKGLPTGSLVCNVFLCFSSPEPLAHGELLRSSIVGCPSSVLHRLSSVLRCVSSTIALKDISSKTTCWILTKLGRNQPYMSLFKNCSNGSGLFHI